MPTFFSNSLVRVMKKLLGWTKVMCRLNMSRWFITRWRILSFPGNELPFVGCYYKAKYRLKEGSLYRLMFSVGKIFIVNQPLIKVPLKILPPNFGTRPHSYLSL